MLEVTDLKIEIEDNIIPDTVVYDFDIKINAGEIVGIVGESGSGKSMSAMAIAGLLSRSDMKKSGTISFNGQELLTLQRSKLRELQGNDISVVFQEPMTSLDPLKKIGWQIEEALRIHTDLPDEERYKKAIGMMKEVELKDAESLYERYPFELSGGQRQRVMIAAALICDPMLLIADEPTTALDVTVQAQIIELLRRINKEKGTAILFISHDLSVVKSLCERVVVMNKGRIVEEGPVARVFDNPQMDYTRKLIDAIPKFEKITNKLSDESVTKGELILSVEKLNASYKKTSGLIRTRMERKLIVKDASFDIREGEIVGLVGESGSGKTTLGKAVLGMLSDVEGKIYHSSNNPQMIFQDPYGSLNPSKSIGWILEEPLKINTNMSAQDRKEKVTNMLRLVGLDESYMKRRPSALSGGQRQRVCIALALMLNPKFIVADEPVSALDVTVEKQILELLVRLNKELGIAILFISHDLKVVYEICDKIMVMKDGVIIEQGTDNEIYFAPKEEYTRQLLKSADIENSGIEGH